MRRTLLTAVICLLAGVAPAGAAGLDQTCELTATRFDADSGEQLRYWSFCQNDPFTQRYVACLRDDQVKLDKDGFFTIVISRPSDRPSCARNWIPWGPQPEGVLIYRHMLPDPAFSGAIQKASYGSEATTMGDYFPTPRYLKDASQLACAKTKPSR